MKSVLTPDSRISDFIDWYRRNRERSAQLFGIVDPDAYYGKPIPLRHPIAFYEGHLPAFSFITLVRDTFERPSIDVKLERLFQRGIDPADAAAATAQSINAWPSREEVLAFGAACDAEVERALRDAQRSDAAGRPVQASHTILEHEQMHHETLLYILHRLPLTQKTAPQGAESPADGVAPQHERVAIPGGAATLGAERGSIAFGWDNEFEAQRVDVNAFAIDRHSVTNADYLAFVEAGGPPGAFWVKRRDGWHQLCMFAEIPLP